MDFFVKRKKINKKHTGQCKRMKCLWSDCYCSSLWRSLSYFDLLLYGINPTLYVMNSLGKTWCIVCRVLNTLHSSRRIPFRKCHSENRVQFSFSYYAYAVPELNKKKQRILNFPPCAHTKLKQWMNYYLNGKSLSNHVHLPHWSVSLRACVWWIFGKQTPAAQVQRLRHQTASYNLITFKHSWKLHNITESLVHDKRHALLLACWWQWHFRSLRQRKINWSTWTQRLLRHIVRCVYLCGHDFWAAKKVLLPRWSSSTHIRMCFVRGNTMVKLACDVRWSPGSMAEEEEEKIAPFAQSLHQGAMVWEKRKMIRCTFVVFDTHRQSIWKKMLKTIKPHRIEWRLLHVFRLCRFTFSCKTKCSTAIIQLFVSCIVLIAKKKKMKEAKKKCVCRQCFARVWCTKVQDAADIQTNTHTHPSNSMEDDTKHEWKKEMANWNE